MSCLKMLLTSKQKPSPKGPVWEKHWLDWIRAKAPFAAEYASVWRTEVLGRKGPALIGMESTGNCQWFVDLLARLGHEVWIGDAAKIRASEVRQQKHDRRDATLILKLLREGRFPRIWTSSGEEKDLQWCVLFRTAAEEISAGGKADLG